jgi:hypothetical protein
VGRPLLFLAVLLVACGSACGSFGEAEDEARPPDTAPPSTDGGHSGPDAAAVDTCREEEKTTPRHCGRCGRDCGGGGCVDGECTPYPVVQAPSAWYLAVDATHVYWTSRDPSVYGAAGSGEVQRAPKLGGATPDTLAVDPNAFDLAVVGPAVFFSSFGGAAGTTSGVYRTSAVPGSDAAVGVADIGVEVLAQGDKAYVITRGDPNAIHSVDVTGTATPFATFGTTENRTEGLASDGEYLYWADHRDVGSVARIKLTGGMVQTVVSGIAYPRRIAVDAEFVYWVADTRPAIERARKTGGLAALVLAADVGYGRVIADARHLYATIDREGRVIRMDKDGANVRTVAPGLGHPVGLAQDDVAIYFSDCSPGGSVWRMVK